MKIIILKTVASWLISIFVLASAAFADQAADKAEFKKLYAEFNELYANSEAIDPLIKLGEKLYKTARKVYGKNHTNTAVVTYNLALLYDEKGGETDSKSEKKALKLYIEYFKKLDRSKEPKHQDFLNQYIKYIVTYYNVNGRNGKQPIIDTFFNTVNNLKLSLVDIANYEFKIATTLINNKKPNAAIKLYSSAIEKFKNEPTYDKAEIVTIEYMLALHMMKKDKADDAILRFENVISTYENNNFELDDYYKNSLKYLSSIYFYKKDADKSNKHIKKFIDIEVPIETRTDIHQFGLEYYLPRVRINPYYPSKAVNQMLDAFVYVLFDVDGNGDTQNVHALASSHYYFDHSAVQAAKKYKYDPIVKNGVPVIIKNVLVRIEFIIS